MKQRLDIDMVRRKLVASRSEAENWIRLGKVSVNGQLASRPGQFVDPTSDVKLATTERYVSRAGLKLASVASKFNVVFTDATVLDVGSSTGGFTDYALQHGAKKVFAIDVGTEQLHPSLRGNKRIELHEKTDIRNFTPGSPIDIVVIDVSFISIRDILPHIASLSSPSTIILAMVKPQFEAGKHQINKGVIKNDTLRREILRDFEVWSKQYFVIQDKADSTVHGARGNQERFYVLRSPKT
ncbi:MAG: TlyA family RNA methyltransferase [Candidatus Saccharimonadales bacterium]